MKILISLILLFIPCFGYEADIRAFGAKGDGSTNDSTAVQNAVNAACSAGTGAMVHVPRGTFVVSGITIGCGNISISGDGGAVSQFYPTGNNTTIFTVTGSKQYLGFSGILFFNALGATGNTAISIVADVSHNYPYYSWIHDIGCTSVAVCINIDQARMVKVTDIQLVGQSTIFVGSTTDVGPDPYAHDISLQGIHHYPNGASLSGALMTIQRGVNVAVTNFTSMGLQGTMDGIDFVNDTQGVKVTSMSVIGAASGINALNTTVGSTTVYSQDISIENSEFDQCNNFCIQGGNGASGMFTITIVGNHFTNFGLTGAFTSAVAQHSNDWVINDNTFWISLTNGNGITVTGQGVQVNNNHFSQMGFSGGNCIYIVSGSGADFYEVQGNTSRARGGSAGFITDLVGGAHKSVQSLASWPN